MKLENIELTFDNFSREMEKLYKEKHFDYLVTIVGEDFGEEGLGCIYILENTPVVPQRSSPSRSARTT